MSAFDRFLPESFPLAELIEFRKLVDGSGFSEIEIRRDFTGGCKALSYRYHATTTNHAALVALIEKHGDSPIEPYRYRQEQEFFEFFCNGLSSIEGLCYALYALGTIHGLQHFSLLRENKPHRIDDAATSKAFKSDLPSSPVSDELDRLIQCKTYSTWKRVRNVLSHRQSPARTFYEIMDEPGKPADWFCGLTISVDETIHHLNWLSGTLGCLLTDAVKSFDN